MGKKIDGCEREIQSSCWKPNIFEKEAWQLREGS